jgi:phage tail-like protein
MPRDQELFLLNQHTGWQAASLEGLSIDLCSGDLRLAPAPGSVPPLNDPAGTLGGLIPPVGTAVDCEGRTYVLDRTRLRIRKFDDCASEFKNMPCLGGEGCQPRQFRDPRSIAISCFNDLYVVDTGNRRIQVFALCNLALRDIWGPCLRVSPGATASERLSAPWNPVDIAIAGPNIFVADSDAGSVYLLDCDGRLVRTFGGFTKPVRIAVDLESNLYVVEEGNPKVTVLDKEGKVIGKFKTPEEVPGTFCPRSDEPQQQPATQFVLSGVYRSAALDSRIYQCVWNRVLLSADIPAGCRIRVDTLTAEDQKEDVEVVNLPEQRWARGQINVQTGNGEWDCLIQSPPARYLWLRLTLEGEGSATASIHQIRIYYPRNSSLQFLPGVFQQDPLGAAFLDEFLSILDSFWDGIGDRLTDIASLFDPLATPPEFLNWLSSWIGIALDPCLPLARKRNLLKNAYRLFELRGTPAGLREYIRLYTGSEPTILEHFRLRRWFGAGNSRVGSTELFGSDIVNRLQLGEHSQLGNFQLIDFDDPLRDPFFATAHRFSVFVPAAADAAEVDRARLQRLVELAKPAYTEGTVHLLRPRFRVGLQAFIGVDTVIGEYPPAAVVGESALGCEAVARPGPCCQPASGLRIGATALMN